MIDPRLIQHENIICGAEGLTFSERAAAYWVGGKKKLAYLVQCGKIHVDVNKSKPNSKHRYNARQVLENVRNFRAR